MDNQNNEQHKIRLINKSKRKDAFLVIDNNGYIRDIRLSFKAKGILTLMLTNKEDWFTHPYEIVRHSKDGISSLSSGCKELIDYKYVKKVQERNEKGYFIRTLFYVYDEPYDNSPIPLYKPKKNEGPEIENPKMENPVTDYRKSENKALTKKNIKQEITELTNPDVIESESHKPVSESLFASKIKQLFDGDFPFDKNFENDVLKFLADTNITETSLENYLEYVYKITELKKPRQSFAGLFRTLVLSKSVRRDFLNSSYVQKTDEIKKSETKINEIECPICSTRFLEIDFTCPTCKVTVNEIKKQKEVPFIAKKKIYEMSDAEKRSYNTAFDNFTLRIREQTKRNFLLDTDYAQFWREYGLVD